MNAVAGQVGTHADNAFNRSDHTVIVRVKFQAIVRRSRRIAQVEIDIVLTATTDNTLGKNR